MTAPPGRRPWSDYPADQGPDAEVVRQGKDQVKQAIKVFHQGDTHAAFSLARRAVERLFTNFNDTGFTNILQDQGRDALSAYPGLSQGEASALQGMGLTDAEIRQTQNALTEARQYWLNQPSIDFKQMMKQIVAGLKRLEATRIQGADLTAQGWLSCAGSILGTISVAFAFSGACAITFGAGCVAGLSAGTGAVMLTIDSCGGG